MTTSSHPHQHSHDHAGQHGPGPDDRAMAEMLELDAEVLQDYLAELTGWLGELADGEPQRIVDLGAGPGTGAFALARQFPQARVSAVDLSPLLLHRLSTRAATLGLADRVTGVEADLDAGLPDLGPADLIWAASSLHHMTDPDRVLADAFAALRPGGLLAVTEMHFFPRFLPADIGVGEPGLEERIHTILDTSPFVDWTENLARAGFTVEAARRFDVHLTDPGPAAARYAENCLGRLRSHLDGQLSAEDLAALDALLDGDGPHGLARRSDLEVRTTRTTWAARRP